MSILILGISDSHVDVKLEGAIVVKAKIKNQMAALRIMSAYIPSLEGPMSSLSFEVVVKYLQLTGLKTPVTEQRFVVSAQF